MPSGIYERPARTCGHDPAQLYRANDGTGRVRCQGCVRADNVKAKVRRYRLRKGQRVKR